MCIYINVCGLDAVDGGGWSSVVCCLEEVLLPLTKTCEGIEVGVALGYVGVVLD